MQNVIIGIDPGVTGAVAVISPAESPYIFDMPTVPAKRGKAALDVDARLLAKRIDPIQEGFVFIEHVTSRPRQAGQFAFGVNFGRVLGVLEAHGGLKVIQVPSSQWKQAMGLRGADKDLSVALAVKLFPTMKPHFYGPKGGALHGRAEALLLAYYGHKSRRF